MNKYSATKTSVKAGTITGTVAGLSIVAAVITHSVHPWLSTHGADVDPLILVGIITGMLQGICTGVMNWFKHRSKDK